MAYEVPAGNAIDFDLGNGYTPPAGDSINFNLEESESPVNLFDGKLTIKDTTINLFDGWTYISNFTQDLFDGKAQIKDTTFDLFDGEAVVCRTLRCWYSGGNLNTARHGLAGCGTQTAALSFGGYTGSLLAVTEEYNGVSWSTGGDLTTARRDLGGCGTQIAGLSFGGYVSTDPTNKTEEYNGTTWANGGNLALSRTELAGCGTQAAGLSFGGHKDTAFYSKTEEYNGTAWADGGNLNYSRAALAGAGTQTAGLSFGGRVGINYRANTEEYNGTSWISSNDILTARKYLGGCGSQQRGLCFGGFQYSVRTEEYNGTSWINGGDLNTGRHGLAGAGTQTAGLSFGGLAVSNSVVTEEYEGVPLGTDLFDGWLRLYTKTTDLFDGVLYVGVFATNLFDGELQIKDSTVALFDGFSVVSWGTPEVWLSAANMPAATSRISGAGTQTAGLAIGGIDSHVDDTVEYNGTSWSAGGDLLYSYLSRGGCGYQTAALVFGGYYLGDYRAKTEEYNGTSWAVGGDLLRARMDLAGAGTQNAGLCFGGLYYSTVYVYATETEEYNGTSWVSGGNLATGRDALGGAGTQNAGLSFGGCDSSTITAVTEEYNGTSWASGGALSLARQYLGGCGSQTCALSFGGDNNSSIYYNKTEKYNGTSWLNEANLITARSKLGGCGFQTFGLSFGGYNGSILSVTEEYSPLSSTDVFDGKLKTYKTQTDLFDGKAQIKNVTTDLFDGELYVGIFATNFFDGKLRLGYRQRQKVLLGTGEPYKIDIKNAFGFPFKFDIFSPLGCSEIRKVLVGLGDSTEYLLHIPLAQVEHQQIVNHLSDSIDAIQILLNDITLGDPLSGRLPLLTSIQSEFGIQSLVNELSGILAGAQKLLTALTESVSSHISLINELALKNDIQSIISLLGSITDITALYPDCSINIYLDGAPLSNNRIKNLSFVMDRVTTFDVLSFSSTDAALYLDLQKIVGDADFTVEIQYKGTSWFFLIEEVSGYELSFNVWGRSIAAAKSDAPFKESSNFVLEADTMASVVAEDLIPELSITWNAVDWNIMADWTVDGTPVQMLKKLADSIGAVVRSYPDGTGFYVDEKYTTRPVNLLYATPIEEHNRDIGLISLDGSRDLGTGANSVTVRGYSPFSKYSIRLETESCVDVGNPAIIKVYPALEGVGYSLVASDGAPTYQYSLSEEHVETVSFVGGKGSVSYPIVSLTSITWDGAVPAGFEYTAGQDEIILTDETLAAVGEVTYTTRYDVWYGTHSGEGELLVVCYLDEGGGIVAQVYFGDGDREADDIDRSILTSIEAAVTAGQAFLDDTSYNKLLRAIVVPCSSVSDGDVISVFSDLSGVTGNTFVLRHEISATVENGALKISSNLNIVQFEV